MSVSKLEQGGWRSKAQADAKWHPIVLAQPTLHNLALRAHLLLPAAAPPGGTFPQQSPPARPAASGHSGSACQRAEHCSGIPAAVQAVQAGWANAAVCVRHRHTYPTPPTHPPAAPAGPLPTAAQRMAAGGPPQGWQPPPPASSYCLRLSGRRVGGGASAQGRNCSWIQERWAVNMCALVKHSTASIHACRTRGKVDGRRRRPGGGGRVGGAHRCRLPGSAAALAHASC